MSTADTASIAGWLVAAWGALVLALNVLGVFATPPERPPVPLLIAVLGPPIVFGVAYASSARVRAWALRLDLRLLTAMQAWRVIGGMFLVLMWGVLSGRSPVGLLRGDVTTDVMQELPLSMIPTFAVPFWIILHLISLLQVRAELRGRPA